MTYGRQAPYAAWVHPQSTPRKLMDSRGGRFYCNDENDERKLKTQRFDAIKYPTIAAVGRAVEPHLGALTSATLVGKVRATMNTPIRAGLSHPSRGWFEQIGKVRISFHIARNQRSR